MQITAPTGALRRSGSTRSRAVCLCALWRGRGGTLRIATSWLCVYMFKTLARLPQAGHGRRDPPPGYSVGLNRGLRSRLKSRSRPR